MAHTSLQLCANLHAILNQIIGDDKGVQGSFKIVYSGITFSVQFYYALGGGGGHTFDVGPPSGAGISLKAQTPVLAADVMTCSLEASDMP